MVPTGFSYPHPFHFLLVAAILFAFRKLFLLISCSLGKTANAGIPARCEKIHWLPIYRYWCSSWNFWALIVPFILQSCELLHILPWNAFLFQIKFCHLQIKNARVNKYFLIKKNNLPIYDLNFSLSWQPDVLAELFIP